VSDLLTGYLLMIDSSWGSWSEIFTLRQVAVGLAVNAGLAVLGYLTRSISVSGAVVGLGLGTLVWSCLDWQGYLLLLAFFVIGTGATRLGYRRKESLGLAEARRGRRGARNAIANMGVAAACALLAVLTPLPELFLLAFAGAFGAATADTLESEIGQLWGGEPRLVTTWRPVPAGTDGGVSAVGTLAGAVGALVLAGLGWAVGFYAARGFVAVAAGGFLATVIESLIGATLERAGLLNNEAVNTLNTLAGALLAVAVWTLIGP
jgi:uncharacterized protein (TIGR00297 family)